MRFAQLMAVPVVGAAVAIACAGCTSSSGGSGAASNTSSGASSVSSSASSPSPPTTSASSVASSPTPSPTSSARRPSSWCVDGEITIAETGNPEGSAAGHNSVVLTFTNSSTRTCVLYGYPGADGVDAGGHVVAHAVRSLTGYIGGNYGALKNVSLHPGQVASTILEGDVGNGTPACAAGASLVVTAPNLFHSTVLTGAPYVCAFTVHPVVAGSAGR